MKAIILLLLFFLGLASIIVTFISVITGSYLSEIHNIISFNDKEKYMENDFLMIEKTYTRTGGSSDVSRFDIKGTLKSNGTSIFLNASYSKYVNFELEYQPLYKSKLSGDYYLKGAPENYYKGIYRELYGLIVLKITFYFILAFLIVQYRKYLKNRKFKI